MIFKIEYHFNLEFKTLESRVSVKVILGLGTECDYLGRISVLVKGVKTLGVQIGLSVNREFGFIINSVKARYKCHSYS